MGGKVLVLAIRLGDITDDGFSYECTSSSDNAELFAAVLAAINELAKREGGTPESSAEGIVKFLKDNPFLFSGKE